LDAYNNGLTYVVEKFKDQRISGHIKLIKGERSGLAQLAADLL
jgi:PhoH-like ATPase